MAQFVIGCYSVIRPVITTSLGIQNGETWHITLICLSILMRQQEKHFPTQQHSLQYSFSSENCNTAVTSALAHLQSCKIIGKLSKNRLVF